MAAFQGRATGVSISKVIGKLKNDLDKVAPELAKKLAEVVVRHSPVDTGDYVMSHRISANNPSGQFTGNLRSIGEGGQNQALFQETALNNLLYQIEGLPKGTTKIAIGNTAPHARIVEFGGNGWRRSGYYPYQTAEGMAPLLLKETISEIRANR